MTGSMGIIRHNLVGTYVQALKYPGSKARVDAQKVITGHRKPGATLKLATRTPQMSKPNLTHNESRP